MLTCLCSKVFILFWVELLSTTMFKRHEGPKLRLLCILIYYYKCIISLIWSWLWVRWLYTKQLSSQPFSHFYSPKIRGWFIKRDALKLQGIAHLNQSFIPVCQSEGIKQIKLCPITHRLQLNLHIKNITIYITNYLLYYAIYWNAI